MFCRYVSPQIDVYPLLLLNILRTIHTYRDIRKVCRHKCARQPPPTPPPPMQQCVRKQTRTRAMRTHCGRSVDCAHRLTGSVGTVYIYTYICTHRRTTNSARASNDIRLCANLAIYMLKLNLNKCPLLSGHAQNTHEHVAAVGVEWWLVVGWFCCYFHCFH